MSGKCYNRSLVRAKQRPQGRGTPTQSARHERDERRGIAEIWVALGVKAVSALATFITALSLLLAHWPR